MKAQGLGSDGRTWLEWRLLCFGRGQRVGTTERMDRRTSSESPSGLGLECYVSHTYKPSDRPPRAPPVGMLSPSPHAGLFAGQWDRVPGAALSVAPSQTTSLPAVSTCIVPWPLAFPYPREPSVSSPAPQKAHLPASRRSGPSRTTAPDRLQNEGPALCSAAPTATPRVFAGSLCL